MDKLGSGFMEKGISNNTRFVINEIPEEKRTEIEEYIRNILQEDFFSFQNGEEIARMLDEFLNAYLVKINENDREIIRNYTGLGFQKINSILRGIWDYEKNGILTEKIKKEAYKSASNLRATLLKVPPLSFNLTTYRGVGISAFYPSGISNLEELKYLKGNYFFEEGFTSTSMLRETSFFAHQPDWGSNCNIEITCLIPRDSEDGICLHSRELNYAASQNEFLINNSSLFKILEVQIDKRTNTAKIIMILIPQKLWNPMDYEMERKGENRLK